MRLDGHKGYLEDALTAASVATLEGKLGSAKAEARFVELGLLENHQNEDEGEIMLLAMILLQLHGVKLPLGTSVHSAESLAHKKKRQRTSPEQLAILEQIFQTDKMPNQQTRVQLADQLGMSSRRVQIWFQNKRAKVKRSVSRSSDGIDIPSPSSPLDSSPSPTEDCTNLNSSCSSIPSPPAASPINPQSPPPVSPLSSSKKLSDSASSSKLPVLPLQTSPAIPTTTFSSTQLQFSLSSFESQLQILPTDYTTMRFQTLLKN